MPHRRYRGLASAIDECPIRVLVSLKRGDRFLMTMGTPPIQGWTEINMVLGWAESLQEAVAAKR